jgi:hypothetical protein
MQTALAACDLIGMRSARSFRALFFSVQVSPRASDAALLIGKPPSSPPGCVTTGSPRPCPRRPMNGEALLAYVEQAPRISRCQTAFWHLICGFLIALIVALHIACALYHWLVKGDRVLQRLL